MVAIVGCAMEDPRDLPRPDAGVPSDVASAEDPCSAGLARELTTDARREGDGWLLTHDNSARAVQGALLAPCATAEHVTVWRYVMTRQARLEVTVESADPMETVAWVLDRCEPVLAEPLACAPSAPVSGGARWAQTRTVAILRAGAEVFVAVGGARRPPREGEGPREARGRFSLRVEERAPLAVGDACAVEGSVAECAADTSCQRRGALGEARVCVRDGERDGRCRTSGEACAAALQCIQARCRGPVPADERCAINDPFACVAGETCVNDRDGTTRCVRDGSLGGRCRVEGPACDDLLRCNGLAQLATTRCAEVLTDGDSCDVEDSLALCDQGFSCVVDLAAKGARIDRCQRDGSLGARCRSAGTVCDEGLACDGVPGDDGAVCLRVRREGEPCDVVSGLHACAAPSVCLAAGTSGVCRAPPYDGPVGAMGASLDACVGGVEFTGASLTGDSIPLPRLPFLVRFFGASFDSLWCSPEGYATFGRAPRGPRSARFPLVGEAPAVVPLLADLQRTPRARLCAHVDSRTRRVTLTWRDFQIGDRIGSRVDVSAAVDASGTVVLQHTAIEAGVDALTTTVAPTMAAGIQGEGGVLYLRARIVVGASARFTHR